MNLRRATARSPTASVKSSINAPLASSRGASVTGATKAPTPKAALEAWPTFTCAKSPLHTHPHAPPPPPRGAARYHRAPPTPRCDAPASHTHGRHFLRAIQPPAARTVPRNMLHEFHAMRQHAPSAMLALLLLQAHAHPLRDMMREKSSRTRPRIPPPMPRSSAPARPRTTSHAPINTTYATHAAIAAATATLLRPVQIIPSAYLLLVPHCSCLQPTSHDHSFAHRYMSGKMASEHP